MNLIKENMDYEKYIKSITAAWDKYSIMKDLYFGEISKDDAISELGISKSYIYTLKKTFSLTDPMCYLNKKIGVTVNLKATPDMVAKIIDAHEEVERAMRENNIYVEGRPTVWFERVTYNTFLSMIQSWCPLKITVLTQILLEHKKLSSRSRTRSGFGKNPSVSNKDRKLKPGEEIQMDGKVGIKFPDDDFSCVAHTAVDASTNAFLGIVFYKEEANFAYIQLVKNCLYKYGVPLRVVTDNRTSFTTNKECGDKNVVIAAGLRNLLVELITTSNAKRKNKVESKNDVIQTRVLPLLMVAKVRTMDQANVIIGDIIDQVNADLKNVIPNNNMFAEIPVNFDFDAEFATKVNRNVNKYSQVLYNNTSYFMITNSDEIKHIKNKTIVTVSETYMGALSVIHGGVSYKLVEATEEAKLKYSIKYVFSQTKQYKVGRDDFAFKGNTYHVVDNFGDPIRINAGDSVVKVFNEKDVLQYVTINKSKFLCKPGPVPKSEIASTASEIEVSIRYDATFKYMGNQYIIKEDSKLAVHPIGKITIMIEDGRPSYLIHKKKMQTMHNISISTPGIMIARSHLEAKRLYIESDRITICA